MSRELAPDWILKQALDVQHSANMTWRAPNGATATNPNPPETPGLELTVIGCGTMGIAILGGVMDSLSSAHPQDHVSIPGKSVSGTSTPAEPLPERLPNRFNACVRRHQSAKRIQSELSKYPAFDKMTIYENDNLTPTKAADVILLACKPQMVGEILADPEMKKACEGKLLISICAGVTGEQISAILGEDNSCRVIRVMPNTAAAVRESMTVIATSTPPLPPLLSHLVTWIFTRIGRVVYLPPSTMDASTALCGSGPAFVALFLESLVAGGVAMGLPREEAYTMAAQTMRGTTGLVLQGEHPAILKDKVSTPGGCTIGGLLVLEEGSLKGTVARAVREATVVASQLGQGKIGVNGPRGK
ncbi:pyrroline-5-carboxylate reductase dimerization-domain-containing protein [Neohortaea acidophila]|uniref:Pyrroline-5-carboxylate reductase n=1 Tax=Neohortaea acidophila TaxID=245834 RepID=A0A6A6PN96_9PEZI|nr:pyrroline-5-carboxylate reductase dimerization-domain-containing protein [Neohortaea acidophila]KAF2481296.1 pyrroline-5-carboxylate reductase dimerization-domain-containing protein [Neohortaea acidophila]